MNNDHNHGNDNDNDNDMNVAAGHQRSHAVTSDTNAARVDAAVETLAHAVTAVHARFAASVTTRQAFAAAVEPAFGQVAEAPPVVVLTDDPALRTAAAVAASDAQVPVLITGTVQRVRLTARQTRLLIVGTDIAAALPGPLPVAGPIVLAGWAGTGLDAAILDAERLDADLFVLRPPGTGTLAALLAKHHTH